MPFDGTRAICHACWHRIDSSLNQEQPALPVSASISIPGLTRAANTSRRCMIDDCSRLQLHHLPNSIKVYLLTYFHLYIPNRARICQRHLTTVTLDELAQNITSRQLDFNGDNILDIINVYTLALRYGQHGRDNGRRSTLLDRFKSPTIQLAPWPTSDTATRVEYSKTRLGCLFVQN